MTPDMTQALQSSALIGAIVRPLVVTALLIGLWIGLGRAGRRGTQRIVPWSAIAVIVVAWLSGAWTLSARGVFASAANAGVTAAGTHILLPIILISVGALITLTRSKTMTAVVDAAPLWWLLAFQAYRITGFVFLRLWGKGFLPGYFALPAGIGDMLTGIFAIGAAIALRQQVPWARRFAYAVNIFGLADLVNAVSMGMLTAAKSPAGISPLSLYPLSIVPTFGVPLAVIVHCLSLWQLNRRFQGSAEKKRAYHDPSLGQAQA
jgi:hypothetical protein